jgi:mitochondrial fission protein ELM1
MHVLLICNKKANLGDYNQVAAVARLLTTEFAHIGSKTAITEIDISTRERTKPLFTYLVKSGFWRKVGPTGRFSWLWRNLFSTKAEFANLQPDAVVARLQSSEHAAIALKHWFSIPAFYVGEPIRVDPSLFDLVITTETSQPSRNLVLLETVPSHLFAADRTFENLPPLPTGSDTPIWTFLIGGGKPPYPFGNEDARCWVQFILEMHERHGIKWCISTSRRTSHPMEDYLRRALDGSDAVLDATWWHIAPQKTLAQFIQQASVCIVTAESQSMISDCLNFSKPVIAVTPINHPQPYLSPSDHRDQARIEKFLESLEQNDRIKRCRPDALISLDELHKLVHQIRTLEKEQRWDQIVRTAVANYFSSSART